MTDDNRYQNAFAPWLGATNLCEVEMETLRRRAWHEQRILIVSAHDKRLPCFDKTLLCQIGNGIYGENETEIETE